MQLRSLRARAFGGCNTCVFSSVLALAMLSNSALAGDLREMLPVSPTVADLEQPLAAEQSLVVVTIWEAQPWPPRVPAYYEWELGAAMADLGLRTQFASLREATENSFAGRIVVLRMTSDGESARAHLPAMPSSALAWTHASGPDIAPFGTVDMEAVRSFVRIAPIRLLIDREARLYARALGRVAAHELFHMITRSKEHSERGLMQATLTATELTAEKRPEWLPRNREQAHSAFPQAADGELVAAVSGNRRHE